MVCELYGVGVANASMYDGASPRRPRRCMMARAPHRQKAQVDPVLRRHAPALRADHRHLPALGEEHGSRGRGLLAEHPLRRRRPRADSSPARGGAAEVRATSACVVVQTPNFFGVVEDHQGCHRRRSCTTRGALLVVANTEPVAFGILQSPGAARRRHRRSAKGIGLAIPPTMGGPGVGALRRQAPSSRAAAAGAPGRRDRRQGRQVAATC